MITGTQIRMARAALRWKVADLADLTGISFARLQMIERGDDVPNVHADILETLRKAFENAGVVFIDGDGERQPGVALRQGAVIGKTEE